MVTAPQPEPLPPAPPLAADAPFTHPSGEVLSTSVASVGILVEPAQRRAIAVRPIGANEQILHLDGRESTTPTRYSVQLGPALHLDPFDLLLPDEQVRWRPWMYLNHDCAPNAEIVGRQLRALRDIAPGEGITFDYNATEWELAEPFRCECGSPRCVGLVRGRKFVETPPR